MSDNAVEHCESRLMRHENLNGDIVFAVFAELRPVLGDEIGIGKVTLIDELGNAKCRKRLQDISTFVQPEGTNHIGSRSARCS